LPRDLGARQYVSPFSRENEPMTAGLIPGRPRSILLVRLSARGDVVFASPLVRALRRTYPDARITWMAESHTKDLIQYHPELDDVIVVERHEWIQLWKERRLGDLLRSVEALLLVLRSRHFDVAIDLQGLLRSGVMTFLSGATVRLGLGSKEGSRHLMTRTFPRNLGDLRKISSEYRYLAEELGLEVGDFAMEVPLAPEDQVWARNRVQELGLERGFVAAIPFTTRPQKHWLEDRWAQLLDRVKGELGLPSVILGGPGDEDAFRRIRNLAESEPVGLVGKTSLTRAAALVERASLVIGVDTGLSHMGIAFQRPTVTIFGSTIPYTETLSHRAKVLVHRLECSPCRTRPTCNGDFTCMKLVTVDQVMAAAREVLAIEEGKKEGAPPGHPERPHRQESAAAPAEGRERDGNAAAPAEGRGLEGARFPPAEGHSTRGARVP
jgi:heptosyltransferase I